MQLFNFITFRRNQNGFYSNSKFKNSTINLLRRADEIWYEGTLHIEERLDETVRCLTKALTKIYDRQRLLNDTVNPILMDFDSYQEILDSSRLLKSFNSESSIPEFIDADSPDVSIITYVNSNFLPPVVDHLSEAGARAIQFDAAKDFGDKFPKSIPDMLKTLLILRFGIEKLTDSLTWLPKMLEVERSSNVVWYEWANRNAVIGSQFRHPGVRKVLRLHSYEVLIPPIALIDWSNIDEVILVSQMMENVFRRSVPNASHVPVRVIPNYIDTRRFSENKNKGANKKLALIGWSSAAKDLGFALTVISNLVSIDPTFELHLYGNDFAPTEIANDKNIASLNLRLDELIDAGVVVKHGWTENIENELSEIGFILSTSIRESFHLGLAEGVLSGAIPVVREWPFWGNAGSPSDFLPNEWLIVTPEEAANRVISFQDLSNFNNERNKSRLWMKQFVENIDYKKLYSGIWHS